MSRSSYENYALGPFDAFYSQLQRSKSAAQAEISAVVEDSADQNSVYRSKIARTKNHNYNNTTRRRESSLQELLDKKTFYSQQVDTKKSQIEKLKYQLEQEENVLKQLEQNQHLVAGRIEKLRESMMMERKKRESSVTERYTAAKKGRYLVPKRISPDYTPQPSTVDALKHFHKIPLPFIQEKLIEFVVHYNDLQEERTGWDRVFYNYVIQGWKMDRGKIMMQQDFVPDEEVLQTIMDLGITHEFCQSELKRFVLYWQEKQSMFTPKLWQERFKEWVHRGWQRQQNNKGCAQASRPTTEEFAQASEQDRFYFNFDEH